MCGIAGIIYADANGGREVGRDMTRMLQSMKHRGPDSTGYALFGPPSERYVMRYKLADANDPRDFDFHDRIRRNRATVEQRLRNRGTVHLIEDVPGAEVLSLGHSLEIVKDLGDAESVAEQYDLNQFEGSHAIGHVRMA